MVSLLFVIIIVLIIGFMMNQIGLLIVLNQITLPSLISDIYPNNISQDLIGMTIEMLGGILMISAFMIYIKTISPNQHKKILEEITKVTAQKSAVLSEESTTPIYHCKYCGAEIDEPLVFCPICNRSQQ